MATEAQAQCFLAKRPDIKGFICSNRPDICSQGNLAIVQWWWDKVLIAPGTPDWDLKQQVGGNLDAYLQLQGCGPSGTGGGGGTDGGGGGGGGGTTTACPAGQVMVPVLNQCVDKTLLYVAGGIVAVMILFPGRRR
jgi:hypothetical protein